MSSENDSSAPLLPRQVQPAAHKAASRHRDARSAVRRALDSHTAHYAIVFLVVADLFVIFAEFLLQLFRCEQGCRGDAGSEKGCSEHGAMAESALGIVGVVISCVFLVELALSLWAFGSSFFHSTFRVFDGAVIVVGFVLEVGVKGALEEAGAVVIVLRLWRVFKVVGELSAQAAEQVSDLNEKISHLRDENTELKRRVEELQK